jgi:hypothetical protein
MCPRAAQLGTTAAAKVRFALQSIIRRLALYSIRTLLIISPARTTQSLEGRRLQPAGSLTLTLSIWSSLCVCENEKTPCVSCTRQDLWPREEKY